MKYPQEVQRQLLRDPYAELDIVHDVYIELARTQSEVLTIEEYERRIRFRVSKREIDAARRKDKRPISLVVDLCDSRVGNDPALIVERLEESHQLANWIRSLDPLTGRIVDLFLKNHKWIEIAKLIGITRQAAQARFQRAIERYRALYPIQHVTGGY